jgi:hypothetical protein
VLVVWEEGTKSMNLPPKEYCIKFITWVWDQIGYKPAQSNQDQTSKMNRKSKRSKILNPKQMTNVESDEIIIPGNRNKSNLE